MATGFVFVTLALLGSLVPRPPPSFPSLQCVRAGEVFCGLHVAHIHIICPVRDVTHMRKCTRPSPAFPYCKQQKTVRGLGTMLMAAQATMPANAQIRLTVASHMLWRTQIEQH